MQVLQVGLIPTLLLDHSTRQLDSTHLYTVLRSLVRQKADKAAHGTRYP
jgi:hypothetical protein